MRGRQQQWQATFTPRCGIWRCENAVQGSVWAKEVGIPSKSVLLTAKWLVFEIMLMLVKTAVCCCRASKNHSRAWRSSRRAWSAMRGGGSTRRKSSYRNSAEEQIGAPVEIIKYRQPGLDKLSLTLYNRRGGASRPARPRRLEAGAARFSLWYIKLQPLFG